jgi:hypothetical protein
MEDADEDSCHWTGTFLSQGRVEVETAGLGWLQPAEPKLLTAVGNISPANTPSRENIDRSHFSCNCSTRSRVANEWGV